MDLSGHEGEMPIPISSAYVGQSHGHSIIHDNNPPPFHHHPLSSNGPPAPLSTATPEDHHTVTTPPFTTTKKAAAVVIKYRECLKNHAASIGGNATDGCGEFMPSGEEGTLEALKCSACSCHRNFHRKEVEGDQLNSSSCDCYHHQHHHFKSTGRRQKGVLISSPSDAAAFGYNNSLIPRPAAPHQMIMPLGALQTSESDEMEGIGGVGGGSSFPRPPMVKKRFRTKFTAEQKEKMLSFAERAGWRLQKQEESVVQQLCQEIGVKRRVLKVWMHNNKHNLGKKTLSSSLPSSLNERMDE